MRPVPLGKLLRLTMVTLPGRLAAVTLAIAVDLLVWGGDVTTASGDHVPGWLPPVVTVVAYQSLWALGTRPQVVLALHSTLALVSTMVPKWQPFAGLLLATYAVSSRPRTRHTGALLAWLGAGLLSHSYASARLTSDPVRSTATLLLLWTALVAAIWVAGARQRQVVARARSAGELISSRADRELADERLRIARDLHDGVCAALTAIHLQAAGARAIGATSGGVAAPSLAAIQTSAERSLLELRRVVGDLRCEPGAADGSPTPGPHLAEVSDLVEIVRAAGLRVHLTQRVDPAAVLDPRIEATVVRVVQEGLTNALKHAPAHARCAVAIEIGDRGAHVRISNPQRPWPSAGNTPAAGLTGGGVGLASLRERAALVGGRLTWRADGNRFALELAVPQPVGAGR